MPRDSPAMFETLFSQFAPPPQGRVHDRLFTPFAPHGASPHVLSALFYQHASAPPDEPPPPQHKHFRALVLELMHLNGGRKPPLEVLNAVYVACFERDEAFQAQLKHWRQDRAFCDRLGDVREDVIAELTALERAEHARRAHFSRWRDCFATPIDLHGDSLLDLIAQMQPDDWHEIALGWDWDTGTTELEWIAAQRGCDRATAIHILCSGWPGDIAMGKARPHAGFIRALAARLENGFYARAAFTLALSCRKRLAFQQQLDLARLTGQSPWQVPKDMLMHVGAHRHSPHYAVTNRRAHYQYDHWLQHIAPPVR